MYTITIKGKKYGIMADLKTMVAVEEGKCYPITPKKFRRRKQYDYLVNRIKAEIKVRHDVILR